MALAAGIGAAGSIISGITGGKAQASAAKAQAQAQQAALAQQQAQFNTNQANFAPYMQAGQSALTQQGNILGLGGADAQNAAIQQIQGSPFFQSQDAAGQDALLQAAAATGGLRGGNTEAALYNQRSSLLANAIQSQLAGLGGLSSLGASAAGTAGGLGQNSANANSNIYANQGNAAAASAYGGAANTNSILNGLTSSLGGYLAGRTANTNANNGFTSGFNAFQAGQAGGPTIGLGSALKF